MAGFWQGSGDDGLGEPLHYYGANGKNVADILSGKLFVYDQNGFDARAPEVQSMLQQKGIQQIASPQEVSNAINEDAPGNGAGKGSMKEGILSALAFAAAAGTAGGAFSGMGSAPAWYTEGLANGTIASAGASPAAAAVGEGAGGWFGAGPGIEVAGNATGIGDAATWGSTVGSGGVGGSVTPAAAAASEASSLIPAWLQNASPLQLGSVGIGAASLASGGGDSGGTDYGTTYQGDFGYNDTGITVPDYFGGDGDYGTTYQGDYGYPTAGGTGPQLTPNQLLEQFFKDNPGEVNGGFNGDVGMPWDGSSSGVKVPDWFGEDGSGSVAKSALGKLLDGTATADDYSKLLGTGLSAGLGAYASGQQSDSLAALAKQQMDAEATRYGDAKATSDARYADQNAQNQARYKELLGIDQSRYADNVALNQGRYDQLLGIDQARYADQNAINKARYDAASKLAAEATARGVATQDYAKGVVAPSQARYEGSFQPGFTMSNDPGFMDALNASSKATLHGLSVNGNPAGSPNAWKQSLEDNYTKMAYPALKDFRSQNAQTGYSGAYAGAAVNTPGFININGQTAGYGATPNPAGPGYGATPSPQTTGFGPIAGMGKPDAGANQSAAAIGANSNIFNALGQGLAQVTNPQMTLSDWIKQSQNLGSAMYQVPK